MDDGVSDVKVTVPICGRVCYRCSIDVDIRHDDGQFRRYEMLEHGADDGGTGLFFLSFRRLGEECFHSGRNGN